VPPLRFSHAWLRLPEMTVLTRAGSGEIPQSLRAQQVASHCSSLAAHDLRITTRESPLACLSRQVFMRPGRARAPVIMVRSSFARERLRASTTPSRASNENHHGTRRSQITVRCFRGSPRHARADRPGNQLLARSRRGAGARGRARQTAD
jgi:hypothetical protein